jgi:glycerophosphoryl diester phosphodiesterase
VTPIVIAHRGASLVKPENTIEAFVEARRLGADMVELDVRRTADDALVVHHDAAIPGLGDIVGLAADALPRHVPTLAGALDACEGMEVNVEVKNLPHEPDWDPDERVAAAVATLVGDVGWRERVVVSSFNLAALDAVLAVDAGIRTAWLTLPEWDQLRSAAMARARGHRGLHPHHLAVTAAVVDALHRDGMFCNTWTVDDPERMVVMAIAGVDGICTNAPNVAKQTLAEVERP